VTDRPLYTELAWAYDLIIQKPVERWCGFVRGVLQHEGIEPGSRILDAGCGTGSYAVRLARQGYSVVGLDQSSEMVAQAATKYGDSAGRATFEVGDLLELPALPSFDAVLCRGVLNDLVSDSDRQRVFLSFAGALRKDGLLILDVRDWERSYVSKRTQPVWQTRVLTDRGELAFRSETGFDERGHRLLIRETSELISSAGIERTSFDLAMRCWTQAELTSALSAAGFVVVRLLGDYDEATPVGSTDRIIAIAQLRP
jgi:ubiquinone/menaquinone biosynthesis C-methylase UbiE